MELAVNYRYAYNDGQEAAESRYFLSQGSGIVYEKVVLVLKIIYHAQARVNIDQGCNVMTEQL